jgi:AraC-like DNA-binding protein
MNSRILYVTRLIAQDISHDISTNELASHVNLSVSRLRSLFRHETGASIFQYRTKLRVEFAAELLAEFGQVKQVQTRVRYKDKGRFIRDFKRMYGITPSAYKEKMLTAKSPSTTGKSGGVARSATK